MKLLRYLIFALLLLLAAHAVAEESMGDASFRVGAYDEADLYYRQELAATTDPAARRIVLLKLLGVAQARNDMAGVFEFGNQLQEALKGTDDPQVAMRLHLFRGVAAVRSLHPEEALEAYRKARPLAERLYAQGDPGGALGLAECNSYDYIGPIFLVGRPTPQDYEKACFSAYEPAVSLPASVEKPLWIMDVTRTVAWNRLWVWKAWEYFLLAYRGHHQKLADQWAETAFRIGSASLTSLNQSFQATRNLESASGFTHVILELTEAFPLAPWAPQLLERVASSVAKWPDTAEKYHVQARYYRSIARAEAASSKYEPALDHYQKSAELFREGKRRLDEMDVKTEIGYVYLLDNVPSTRWQQETPKILKQVIALTDQIQYPYARYYALGFLGTIRAREGNLEEAEQRLKEALDLLAEWSRNESPQARAQRLSRPEVRLFSDTLIDVLVKRDKKTEAADTISRLGSMAETAGLDLGKIEGKARETSVRLRALDENRRQRGELLVQLQSAQSLEDQPRTQRLSRQLADNKADFQKTLNNLRRDDPDFERMVAVRPSSFAKIQAILPKEAILVAYYPSQTRTLIFAVTREKLHIYSSNVSRDELRKLIRDARRSLIARRPADRELKELRQSLLEPLAPLLAEKKVLTIVPSDMLYYLPFAALKSKDGAFLTERIGVSLMTATELPDLAAFGNRPKPSRLLALANPDGSLPWARAEVEKIAPLFPEARTYYEGDATRDKIDGSEDVIHFATHGVLDAQDVNESYLVLSGDQDRLTVGEIYGLDLDKVSLVTLSACQTAVGELNPGAEIATLSQAFSVAGSKSMLGSLWKVDDEATAFFMGSFYRHLTLGNEKVEALRLAQVETSHSPLFKDPYYWSGFVLLGDWR